MSNPVTLITSESDYSTVTNTAQLFSTLVMSADRDYRYVATVASWIVQGPYVQVATKAFLALGPETTNINTVVEAKVAGTPGNSLTIAFVADGTGVGSLDESGYPAIVFHFEDLVTTVTNFEDAVTASTRLGVRTAGTGSNTFADPDDVLAPDGFAGGLNDSLVTPIATAGAGSTYLSAGEVAYLDGARGSSLSILRASGDGVATLTPIARDKIGV